MAPKRSGRKGRGKGATLPLVASPPRAASVLMSYTGKHASTEGAAGVGAAYFYRLNSVFDPDATGVGTVAIPYNTWAGLYLSYKVRRVTVRVQAQMTAGSATSFGRVTVAPVANQAVVPANPATWTMLPMATTKPVAINTQGGRNVITFTNSYDLASVAKVTKQQYANDMDFSGAVGSSPARQLYLLIGCESIGSAVVGSFAFAVYVTYDVEWFNPVPMQ